MGDGEELAQSMAIARFVARKVGLAGNSDSEFCQADMIACHYEDIWTKLPKMKFAKSQEEREELAKDFSTSSSQSFSALSRQSLPSAAMAGSPATMSPSPTWQSCAPSTGCRSRWRCPSRT